LNDPAEIGINDGGRKPLRWLFPFAVLLFVDLEKFYLSLYFFQVIACFFQNKLLPLQQQYRISL